MQQKSELKPYPAQYCLELILKDGTALEVRPIRSEDEPLLATFHFTLSEESVYSRYFTFLDIESRINHERLTKQCSVDYDHEMAYIALTPNEGDPTTGERSAARIVGVGRLIEAASSDVGEIAIVVSDAFRHRGDR